MFDLQDTTWEAILANEFKAPYFIKLQLFLEEEAKKYSLYPPKKLVFNALDTTSFADVKVIILGQDPYHGKGQAQGLSFSVPKGLKPPPSLKNIYKELANEYTEFCQPDHGDLTSWAKQGVLLLNATLTVRAKEAGSHQNQGWERFTDQIISLLSEKKNNLVFILWGNYAQLKKSLINSQKHLIIESAHPSPFSAYRGFFNSKPFSKTNEYLKKNHQQTINWLSICDEMQGKLFY